MRICLITPAPPLSRAGNRTTAVRWARLLRGLGHRVDIAVRYTGQPSDVMIALHAWRSADSVQRYREERPECPLILALTGTDLYQFIHTHPEPTRRSMELADHLVCLHDAVYPDIPRHLHEKVRVIYQSAEPLPRRLAPSKRHFEVCVIGHLRDVKDPLRTAEAVRALPPSSRIRVLHLGKAHDQSWAEQARAEMAANPRYRWCGEVPHWQVRRALARMRLLVLSSRMEGGANVVSEAVVAGVPVLSSDIPGSRGLLGNDYPGYFPVGDTEALTALLSRAETDAGFDQALRAACAERVPLFAPERERAAWAALVEGIEATR
jgi:putative glycosyltransferase (TIGR04348 family)